MREPMWKKNFRNLFVTNDESSMAEAFALKKKFMPKVLYRYRSLNNSQQMDYVLSELCNGEVYLAHVNEMNDPFEASTIVKRVSLENSKTYKFVCETCFRYFMTAEDFENVFKSTNWKKKLRTYVSNSTDDIIKAIYNEIDMTLKTEVMSKAEQGRDNINQLTKEVFRIACFTEKSNNLPMWTHYATGHAGICFEYNISDLNDILVERLFPVFYRKELPDLIGNYIDSGKVEKGFTESIVMTKLMEWSYEKEWRLIIATEKLYENTEYLPVDIATKGKIINFTRPSKVILGYKIGKAHELLFRKMGEEMGIQVVKMTCSPVGLKEAF
ncbi:MAG: DUF2971 domain-containing protein [Phascolarctobacterium sp.]|nr:DUF2971 domain-containing protein [Phascolarctobacterium sp.]